jgi:hypothetical protein
VPNIGSGGVRTVNVAMLYTGLLVLFSTGALANLRRRIRRASGTYKAVGQ